MFWCYTVCTARQGSTARRETDARLLLEDRRPADRGNNRRRKIVQSGVRRLNRRQVVTANWATFARNSIRASWNRYIKKPLAPGLNLDYSLIRTYTLTLKNPGEIRPRQTRTRDFFYCTFHVTLLSLRGRAAICLSVSDNFLKKRFNCSEWQVYI